jgi:hypothetical protein
VISSADKDKPVGPVLRPRGKHPLGTLFAILWEKRTSSAEEEQR